MLVIRYKKLKANSFVDYERPIEKLNEIIPHLI
jgi:hypothetical protein